MANTNPFYNNMYGVLYQEASNQGLPNPDVIAHLGAAQAAQETGFGKHAPGNNYFGIKGPGQKLKTTESVDGELVPSLASFRQYSSMNDSAAGYLDFLKSNPRYRNVLNAKTPEEAISLQGKTGYATDPNYGSTLANIYRNNGNAMPSQNGIMNQVDPDQQPVTYRPQAILQQNPDAGILERIANAPGMSNALIQMGAGLLSSTGEQNPLAAGLSKGFAGFNSGLTQGIENNKAKAVPIAGGAFTQITDSRGNVTIVPNSEAQKFILQGLGIRGQNAINAQDNRFKNAPLTAKEQEDNANRQLAIQGFTQTKSDITDLDDFATTKGPGVVAGMAGTGVGKDAAALGSHFSSTAADASAYQQKLGNVLTTKWLDLGQKLKGAQSDAEGKELKRTMPDPRADYNSVIKPWLERYKTWLDANKDLLDKQSDPNNRYPQGSDLRTDTGGGSNTGLTAAPPKAVDSAPLPEIGTNPNDRLNLGDKLPSLNRNR